MISCGGALAIFYDVFTLLSPGEGSGNPLQYSRLENFMEKRSLVGSPWDCKELDMTERLSLSLE